MTRAVITCSLLTVLLLFPAIARAQETEAFAAPVDRVWAATLAALERQGWGVAQHDCAIGRIVSRSHRLAGSLSVSRRVQLALSVRTAGDGAARVTVEREIFDRERVLWIRHDEFVTVHDPLMAGDRALERSLLAAIRHGL
ncbi:MAG: hypothetical protein HY294_00725 [Candidatus Rokubacteria bacterium]|nr:hypothetical protein [Candidatus Rokubacteria bacterium]MBI3824504.1 hypothetical protein [Candidatus Rokubacteria bacterium]